MARLRSKLKLALPDHFFGEKRLQKVESADFGIELNPMVLASDLVRHGKQAKNNAAVRPVKNLDAGRFEVLFSFAFEGGFFL